MPDAYFDSNLNGNLRTATATRDLVGNLAVQPIDINLLAITAAPFYFDSNVSTLRTNVSNRIQIVFDDTVPNNTNSLATTAATFYFDSNVSTLRTNVSDRIQIVELPYRVTRSPTITSRFTE